MTSAKTSETSTTSTSDERAEVQGRLDAIRQRTQARAGGIGDIERRQLGAATAGEAPDPQLSAQKAALLDAQRVDEQAAAVLQARLDQIAAQERRERELAGLAEMRARLAQLDREAREAAELLPGAVAASMEALRVIGESLAADVARARELGDEAAQLRASVVSTAERLGEAADVPAPADHVEAAYRSLGEDLHRQRVFNGARRNAADAVTEIGAAVTQQMSAEMMRRRKSLTGLT